MQVGLHRALWTAVEDHASADKICSHLSSEISSCELFNSDLQGKYPSFAPKATSNCCTQESKTADTALYSAAAATSGADIALKAKPRHHKDNAMCQQPCMSAGIKAE